MVFHTNGIDISKLPFDAEIIKPKGVDYYKNEVTQILKESAENAKKGFTVFKDEEQDFFAKKQSLKIDF